MKSSGLIPDTDKTEIMEIMVVNARGFFRAGGTLTLQDWAELNNSERIAFIKARESFQRDIEENILLEKVVDRTVNKFQRGLGRG